MLEGCFFYFIVVLLFLTIGLSCLFSGLWTPGIIFLVLSVAISIFVVKFTNRMNEDSKFIEMNKKENTLLLHSRCSRSESNISIVRYDSATLKYNPAEVTYTGVTIGPVSTGKFNVSDPYYSAEHQSTDKFQLYYRGTLIEKIICDFEIKKTPAIKPFVVDKNTLLLRKSAKRSEVDRNLMGQAAKAKDWQTASLLSQEARVASMLTKDECKQIKAWIGGKDL